jgi:hypothetical protein
MSYTRFLMGSGRPYPLQLPLKNANKPVLKSWKKRTDKERHRALKIFSAEREISMYDLVAIAIDKILAGEIETP